MSKHLWRWVFAGCLGLVTVALLSPTAGGQMLPGQDKLLHGVTFMGLFLVGVRACPDKGRHKWLFAGLLGYGIAIELLQGLTGYRAMEAMDAVADLAGLAVGVLWSLRKPGPRGCCG